MKRFLLTGILAFFIGGCASQKPATSLDVRHSGTEEKPAYEYPINNPYAATIIGMPETGQNISAAEELKIRENTLVVFKDRKIPEGFWYEKALRYGEILQPNAAPLIYIIAGTGANYNSPAMVNLGRAFYRKGFHVVLLPSTTHTNFIVTASENFIPGRPQQAAKDLYRVMKLINQDILKTAQVTERYLTGYSLGAMDAAFTGVLDEKEKTLDFKRILLINPPLSLYNSINIIDGWLYRGLPNGIDGVDQFIDTEMARLSVASPSGDPLDFQNARLLIEAYTKYPAGDERLATMIGLAFRIFAANMIFTSDVMAHTGYIFPSNVELTTGTSLNEYLSVALRTSFLDYFKDVYAKKYAVGDTSREDLIKESSLEVIGGDLSQDPKFGLITNADDIILAPGELDTLKNIFGSRAKIFPNGGHLGNLSYPPVINAITHFMTTGSQE